MGSNLMNSYPGEIGSTFSIVRIQKVDGCEPPRSTELQFAANIECQLLPIDSIFLEVSLNTIVGPLMDLYERLVINDFGGLIPFRPFMGGGRYSKMGG